MATEWKPLLSVAIGTQLRTCYQTCKSSSTEGEILNQNVLDLLFENGNSVQHLLYMYKTS